MDEEKISWDAPEFEYREKGADWYWIFGIIAIAGIFIAIIIKNLLFAILIAIAAVTAGLYANKKPEIVSFEISRRGIRVGKTLYPYSSLESFWINEENEHYPKLLLTSEKTLALQIIIPLQNAPIDDIHDFLLDFVEEEEQHESIVERLAELAHF